MAAAAYPAGAGWGAGAASAPVSASGTVVVRGASMPPGTGLAHLRCDSPSAAGLGGATPYVGRGPARSPLGERTLGFDLVGGDAAGPVVHTSSLAGAGSASMSAFARSGTTGVAWVGYRDPSDPAGVVWFGRAPLAVPAGGWHTIDTAGLTYDWATYDVATGARLASADPATVAALVAARGDGPGLTALTLGCDGAPFSLDAMRWDATTYDFEGLTTRFAAGAVPGALLAGTTLVLRGSLSSQPDVPIAHATAILERDQGDGWELVRVVDVAPDGSVSTSVAPPVRTAYRWRFADRPLAEGATSPVQVVEVERAVFADVDGDRVVGRVTPWRTGLPVTLRRAGSDEVVATTTTTDGGRYAFTATDLAAVTTGSYVVSTAADAGSLRGDSLPLQLQGADPTRAPEPTPTPEPSPPAAPTPTPTSDPTSDPTRDPTRVAEPTRTPDPTPTPSPAPTTGASPTPAPSTEPTPSGTPAAAAPPDPAATSVD